MKALRNIIRIVAAVAGFFGLITLVLILAGYRPYILKTASMEPVYPKGSLCWVDTKVKLDSVSVGDVLVYRSPTNMLVLHRLVDILPIQAASGSLSVTMQGDANNTQQDILLSNINCLGRESFTIPRLGEVVERLLSDSGTTWFFVVFFLILACIPWESIHRRIKKNPQKEEAV